MWKPWSRSRGNETQATDVGAWERWLDDATADGAPWSDDGAVPAIGREPAVDLHTQS
ncbi:hypothetical protein [Alicyclobacillus macrosporangiidus]|uniref:hypothetical protein n=1 Tax=Alicyclobacillus macrosporangiidus TaxID=392015 RepID=UPI000ABEFE61|nr:hypothetical protein [Alicyclobacillus macrosporangiidus]